MACDCKVCLRSRRIQRAMKRRDPDVLIAIINELYEELEGESTDASHQRAILDGSWPGSVEILERALEHARSKTA